MELRNNIAGTPLDFLIDPGNIIADDPQGEHDNAPDQQDQKDHRGEAFHCVPRAVSHQCLDAQHNRKHKNNDSRSRHKLHGCG